VSRIVGAFAVPPGMLRTARICRVGLSATVSVTVHVRSGEVPPDTATGQVTADPSARFFTFATGTSAQLSRSERRYWKVTPVAVDGPAAASVTSCAVVSPSTGAVTAAVPT
jgi:hypothetical protein